MPATTDTWMVARRHVHGRMMPRSADTIGIEASPPATLFEQLGCETVQRPGAEARRGGDPTPFVPRSRTCSRGAIGVEALRGEPMAKDSPAVGEVVLDQTL